METKQQPFVILGLDADVAIRFAIEKFDIAVEHREQGRWLQPVILR